MPGTIHRRTVRTLAAAAAAAALALGLVVAPDVAPAAVGWQRVDLSGYRFGSSAGLTTVLAKATAGQVGFELPSEGAAYGPWSFDLTASGQVWVLDEVNDRILTWRKGSGSAPTRVALPYPAPEDFAVAADGRLYVDFKQGPPGPRGMVALSPSGSVLWTIPVSRDELFGTQLRIGPDRRLYKVGEDGWRPLTDVAGRPLTPAQQTALTTATQPLTGGLRLALDQRSSTDLRVVLTDWAGTVVRHWRVTTAAPVEVGLTPATAAMIGSDLAVPLDVFGTVGGSFRYETVVLRLSTGTGALTARIGMDHHAFFGDEVTRVRIAPDGAVVELRSSPQTGIAVVRHAWPGTSTSPTTSGSATATGSATTSATSTGSASASMPGRAGSLSPTPSSPAATPSVAPSTPSRPAGGSSGGAPSWVPVAIGLVAVLSAGGALWSWRRSH